MELVLLIGLPASGKTTYCLSNLARSHLRLSRDMLGTARREEELFATALRTGTRIVIDNTSVTRDERARFIHPAQDAGFSIRGMYFDVGWARAQELNASRDETDRVPGVAIGDKAGRLERPSFDEGFDELLVVRMDGDGGFVTEGWPDAAG